MKITDVVYIRIIAISSFFSKTVLNTIEIYTFVVKNI